MYGLSREDHRWPGVNLTNVLHAAFTLVDPESVKKIQLSHPYLFTYSGSASIKAVHRMLMKLSPGVNFTNILHTSSFYGGQSQKRKNFSQVV